MKSASEVVKALQARKDLPVLKAHLAQMDSTVLVQKNISAKILCVHQDMGQIILMGDEGLFKANEEQENILKLNIHMIYSKRNN